MTRRSERIFKILLDAGLIFIFMLVFIQWLNIRISGLLAILLAHTISFIFNAHRWWAVKHNNLVRNP